MLISLVMVTVNRVKEVEVFLEALSKQIFKEYELIIVDQNKGNCLLSLVEKYSRIYKVIHIKSDSTGISKNRNIGLEYVSGDIIAFPDDDCEYKNDTLQIVCDFFKNNKFDFFTFAYEDKLLQKQEFKKKKCKINYYNIFESGISFTIFAKKNCFIGFKFDELLGVNATFGSGEEGDMLFYFLSAKNTGCYNGFYTIYHPKHNTSYDCKRAYNYALGFGAVHKKAVIYYRQYIYLLRFIMKIIINIVAIIISPHKNYYFHGLKGKIRGFLKYYISRRNFVNG